MKQTKDLTRLADEELMHVAPGGDPRAFELLYDRHAGAAFSLAYRMVGTRQARLDPLQWTSSPPLPELAMTAIRK